MGGVEHHAAQSLADLGAAGLAQAHDLQAVIAQRPLEEADVRRLARAVPSFEGNEDAADPCIAVMAKRTPLP